jgi:hypothetical protein
VDGSCRANPTGRAERATRKDGDGVTRQDGSIGRMISQHWHHEGAAAAPLARENHRHPQRPMSDPHLANWLFLVPAFLLGATIERGAGEHVSPRSVFPCSFGFVEALESEAEAVG